MNRVLRLWDWFLDRSFTELLAGGFVALLIAMTLLGVRAL